MLARGLRKLSRHRARITKGQALAEFALVLPILLLIMLFTIDFGRVFSAWLSLNNLARIGANIAAEQPQAWEGSGDAALQAQYRQLMRADESGIDCTLPTTLPAPTFLAASPNTYDLGSSVEVDLTCKFTLLTPFIGGIIGDSHQQISMSASSVFPIRTGSINGIAVGGPPPPPAPAPSISLVKSASPQTYNAVGTVISYSYVVTNTGNVTLNGPVTVTDDHVATPATVTCPTGHLKSGDSTTCTASYTITQADIDAGSVTNTATAHANGHDSNTAQATVTNGAAAAASFYGTPAESGYDLSKHLGPHSQGGGSGSSQVIVAWNADVPISWTNTSTGQTMCSWAFGSGTSPTTSTSCLPSQSIYTQKGTYTVTLTVNGSVTANYTVVAACMVPNFSGVQFNDAKKTWKDAGFDDQNIDIPNGNGTIANQTLSGGTLNPSGGCSGATITVSGATITVGP